MEVLEFIKEVYYLAIAPLFFLLSLWLVLFAYASNKSEKYKHYYPLAWRLLLWMPLGFLVSSGIFGLILVGFSNSLNEYLESGSVEILEASLLGAGLGITPYFFSFFGMIAGGLWAWRGYRRSKSKSD